MKELSMKNKGLIIFLVLIAFICVFTGAAILLVSAVTFNALWLVISLIILIIGIILYAILIIYFIIYFLKRRKK